MKVEVEVEVEVSLIVTRKCGGGVSGSGGQWLSSTPTTDVQMLGEDFFLYIHFTK